jgi:hypothetical protein
MTFQEATDQMLAAIQSRDMEALSHALGARAAAIEAGFLPTAEIIEDGERALRELKELRKGLALDSARLRQLQTGVAGALTPQHRPHVDCKG